MRLRKLLIHLKSSLWFIPVLCVLAGAVLSFATIAVDRYFDYHAVPTSVVGGPDAAAYILSTVAASMVSLTALVLTITMVVVQLAMGQFSPRIVQRILQDKPSQLAIGLFVATFVHAILALREVSINGDSTGNVPGVAVVTAFVLVIVSIAVLVIYVHHIGQALRVSALIELVGDETRTLLDRRYPDKGPALAGCQRCSSRRATESGVVTGIDNERLSRKDDVRTACSSSFRRSASSCPPAAPSSESTEHPLPWMRTSCARLSSSAWSRPSMRTSPTASVSSSTSRNARWPTLLSRTRRLQCKRSTDFTTS